MTSEIDYELMQETAAQGEHIRDCMNAIIDNACASYRTLASLQRRAYKNTDAGISLSFQLDDGTYVYVGDPQANDDSLVNRVRRIGFSSIVEGSDREVAPIWLDLLSDEIYSPQKAVAEYDRMQEDVDAEACEMWAEDNAEEEE